MSLISQQQLLQNQLQMKQLDEQRLRQAEQTRSFQSNRSSTQELLQKLRSTDHKKEQRDPSDPLYIQMPTSANPTETLAARFNSWRNIISCLIHYLKETVSVHEEISRQQIRLHHAITFPFVTQGLDGELYQPVRVPNPGGSGSASTAGTSIFSGHRGNTTSSPEVADLSKQKDEFELTRRFFLPLGSGSIQDLPTVLYQYHTNATLLAQSVVKELNSTIIPRLEDLKRDLLVKIKEIRSLQSDFKNNVDRYNQETKVTLKNFIQSVDAVKRSPSTLAPKNDPYLLKYLLDSQIKKQLTEENYLHEAFINLQTSGKELEKVVYIEIQTALTVYAKLMGQQAQNVFDGLISKLDTGILTKGPTYEWDSYISKDTVNFIDLNTPMRHLSEIRYRYQVDPLTLHIRSGFLERKSKYLKSYARGWYVLTPTFIHEFKTPDRKKDPVPIMSLSLDDCQIAEHSRKDERNPNSYHKFVLHAKQNGGLLRKGHNWVFRAESYDAMMQWYNDLKRLTQLPTPQARSTIAWERRKNRRLSSITGNSSTVGSIASSRVSSGRVHASDDVAAAAAVAATAATPEQSSFRRIHSSQHGSMTNRSIDTMLSMPKTNSAYVPNGSTVVDHGVPQSMVSNDVVVSLPNSSQLDGHAAGGSQLETQVQSKKSAGTNNYVNGELSEKVGELDVSDDPKKETQM
ncbi:hypothetical protein FOA43_003952 [Brettanomyces nanus]|uniref:PH domain-containing protein n=1 Tax=Eeniella nana TaxID=13502 RepID=A0A875S9R7_EENNA|nr:uncharacterized protein FOA43_003952 [Brettanomyces nanus]QPG76562.1 hypothetical protein FOA43_003952 [Brettanomyces nanus]